MSHPGQYVESFLLHGILYKKFNEDTTIYNLSIIQEDYIIQKIDLISGFGGVVGLWLGFSVMTLGEHFINAIKKILNFLFKKRNIL